MVTVPERTVSVPFDRLPGWVRRYDERHPGTRWAVTPDAVTATAEDGSGCRFALPFGPLEHESDGQTDLDAVYAHLARPLTTAVLLARKGGFAVARLVGSEVVASKVGQRHVQGRSKAGGWSQQRFARRRDNQAREAYEAAAGHLAALVVPWAGDLAELGTGGDRTAIDAVLAERASQPLTDVPQRWLGAYPDPKRATLEAAIGELRSVSITLSDPA